MKTQELNISVWSEWTDGLGEILEDLGISQTEEIDLNPVEIDTASQLAETAGELEYLRGQMQLFGYHPAARFVQEAVEALTKAKQLMLA